jgi:hypothetical protein
MYLLAILCLSFIYIRLLPFLTRNLLTLIYLISPVSEERRKMPTFKKGFVSHAWAYNWGAEGTLHNTKSCGPRPTYSKDNPSLTDPALDFTQVSSGKNRLEWESNPQSPG